MEGIGSLMKINIYKTKLQSISQRLNLMTCLVFFMGVSNIMLCSLAWYTSVHQKTYITPFASGNGFNISDGAVDSNYINMMSENFVYAMLNVTPKTVSHQHNLILKYVSPSVYSEFRESLINQEKLIKAKELSSQIEITKIRSNPSTLKSVVTGELSRMVGTRKLKQEQVSYQLNFDYSLGRLSIKMFKPLKGNSND